jgi:hypothetical protein
MPQPSLGCQVKTEASWPSCRTEFGNSIRRATSTLSATSNTEGLSGVRLIQQQFRGRTLHSLWCTTVM